MMTQPAKRNNSDKISRVINHQAWVLLIVIVTASISIFLWSFITQTNIEQTVLKNFVAGSLLSFITQAIFTWFVFQHTGYKARRHIVHQMYRGHMLKWLATCIGFSIIFISIKPLNALAVFIGFILMQISHFAVMWRLR